MIADQKQPQYNTKISAADFLAYTRLTAALVAERRSTADNLRATFNHARSQQLSRQTGTTVASYLVENRDSRTEYTVEFMATQNGASTAFRCACPDYQKRRRVCKHASRALTAHRRRRAAELKINSRLRPE